MTLLTIIQKAGPRSGVGKPTQGVSSTDPNVRDLIIAANFAGEWILQRWDFTDLQNEQTFSTSAAAIQANADLSDVQRFINETFWNRTTNRQLVGPLSAREWQRRQSIVTAGIQDCFRVRGGSLLIDPVPAAGETMAFEYISKSWVNINATAKTAMDDDGDVPCFPEDLMVEGTIWAYREIRGLDYGQTFQNFEVKLADCQARDGSKQTISMDGRSGSVRSARRGIEIQDGDWSVS